MSNTLVNYYFRDQSYFPFRVLNKDCETFNILPLSSVNHVCYLEKILIVDGKSAVNNFMAILNGEYHTCTI